MDRSSKAYDTLQSVRDHRPASRLDLAGDRVGFETIAGADVYGCRALAVVVDERGDHSVRTNLSRDEVANLLRVLLADHTIDDLEGRVG